MKWYSIPSVSPGRGRRVVTDTDSQTSGWVLRISAMTLLLPTPEGPDSTVRRGAGSGLTGELALQRKPLLVPQAADPAGGRDGQLVHELGRPDLADAGHRLEDGRHLHLAHDVVGLAGREHLGQRDAGRLQLGLELGAGTSRLRCLLERS